MRPGFAEFDEIGYWSEVKLDIVREYASAYSKILTTKKLPHIYVDAFAGAGQHISKTTGEFVHGSPSNALNVQPPFREYHFIDLNASKIENLHASLALGGTFTFMKATAMKAWFKRFALNFNSRVIVERSAC